MAWTNITDTLNYNLAGELLGESFSGGTMAGLAITNLYDALLRRTNLSALNVTKLNNIVLSNEIGIVGFFRFLPHWHRVLQPNCRAFIIAVRRVWLSQIPIVVLPNSCHIFAELPS
jgi:hypothetical protein